MSVCRLRGATFMCVQTETTWCFALFISNPIKFSYIYSSSHSFFSQLPSALNWSSLPSTKMICPSTFSRDPTFVINPQQWDSQVFFTPLQCSVRSESYYIHRGKCNGSPHRRPIISAYDHMHQNSAPFPISPALPPFLPLISVVCFYPAEGVSLSPTAREPWH